MRTRSFTPRVTNARSHLRAGDGGFTLIEVLITALIVVLLAGATATALIATTHTSGDQRLRAEADALATQEQARLHGLSDEQLASLGGTPATRTANVYGTTFTVTSTSAFQDSQGNSSCTSTAQDFYKVSTTISWPEAYQQTAQSISVDSLISRPVVGDLQTAVTDQTGAPLQAVSVTAAPGSGTTGLVGQSGQTDTAGCALFAGMTAGSYTVTATKTGYVDSTNTATPTKPASVVATGTPAGNTFVLGKAGGIAATFAASTSTAAPTLGGQADALSYSGSGTTGNVSAATVQTSTTAASAFTTPTLLFPWNTATPPATPSYNNNYAVWAGKCSFQQYPNSGGSTYQLTTVQPGIVSSATVQEPMLYIPTLTAKNSSGTSKTTQPKDIVLTYRSGSCFDSYKATVATSANGVSGYGGTAPTNGWLLNPGQPYAPSGTLTVCADSNASGSYKYGTATVGNTNMTGTNPVPSPSGSIAMTTTGQCTVATS
ncbi:MAG TPA: carboxypeptidase-like regulatory domain-containing protein [Solirubrobacteraceae bacterium]|nr:carboxypeptidase-like regulatory domain-containing protein [Solirubrobacteraceae bacterium]